MIQSTATIVKRKGIWQDTKPNKKGKIVDAFFVGMSWSKEDSDTLEELQLLEKIVMNSKRKLPYTQMSSWRPDANHLSLEQLLVQLLLVDDNTYNSIHECILGLDGEQVE